MQSKKMSGSKKGKNAPKPCRTPDGDFTVFTYSAPFETCVDLLKQMMLEDNNVLVTCDGIRIVKRTNAYVVNIYTEQGDGSSYSVDSRFREKGLNIKLGGRIRYMSENNKRILQGFVDAFWISNRDKEGSCTLRLKAITPDDAFTAVHVRDCDRVFYLEDESNNFISLSMARGEPVMPITYKSDPDYLIKLRELTPNLICDETGAVRRRVPPTGRDTEVKIPCDVDKTGGYRSYYFKTVDLPDPDTLVYTQKFGKKYHHAHIVTVPRPGLLSCVIGRNKTSSLHIIKPKVAKEPHREDDVGAQTDIPIEQNDNDDSAPLTPATDMESDDTPMPVIHAKRARSNSASRDADQKRRKKSRGLPPLTEQLYMSSGSESE